MQISATAILIFKGIPVPFSSLLGFSAVPIPFRVRPADVRLKMLLCTTATYRQLIEEFKSPPKAARKSLTQRKSKSPARPRKEDLISYLSGQVHDSYPFKIHHDSTFITAWKFLLKL